MVTKWKNRKEKFSFFVYELTDFHFWPRCNNRAAFNLSLETNKQTRLDKIYETMALKALDIM